MKYRRFGMVVISLTFAGVAFPARAASLPTDTASPASVAVEPLRNESNAAPWGDDSQPLIEHSVAGELAGDLLVSEVPWKAALADRPSDVGQPALVDTMKLLASPAVRISKNAGKGRGISRWEEPGLAVGPIDYRTAAQRAESQITWVAFLMLAPMIGGVFIAWDVRGGRRRNQGHAPAGVFLYDSPNTPRSVPAALAALGLSADCSEDDVKRAFRQRAKSAHPDYGGDPRDFMILEGHFQDSLRIVRGAAMRARAAQRPGTPRQAA